MKRILNTAIIAIMLLALSITGAYAQRTAGRIMTIGEPAVSVTEGSDSISIRIPVKPSGISVGRNQSLTAAFRIAGEGREIVLPELVYSGPKRFRYDRRSEILSGNRKEFELRHTIMIKGVDMPGEYNYEVAIPVADWLDGAKLHAEYIFYKGCSGSVVGSDTKDIAWDGGKARKAQEKRSYDMTVPALEMVYVAVPGTIAASGENRSVTAMFHYTETGTHIVPGYAGNRASLEALHTVLEQLSGKAGRDNISVSVTGYASPEGAYLRNENLAKARAHNCAEYLAGQGLRGVQVSINWIAEDWDGVVDYLEREKPRMWKESLGIINGVGIFDGRERRLMDLGGGNPYRQMLAAAFPPLRRVEIRIDYRTAALTPAEAERKLFSDPANASLEDVFAAASQYGPADEAFMRIYKAGVALFPDDATVNNNLAAAYLCAGDTASAGAYLKKMGNIPAAYVNKGICRYMEGDIVSARIYFILAVKENSEQGVKNLFLLEKME